MEKKNNKKLFILAGTLLLLVGVIGITFAYFSTGGAQEQANTFSSGCLNIELTNESASISLDNVYPITDIEGLEGTSYDFTIKNNCSTETNYQINLESLNEVANSLSADYIKVSLSSDTNDNVISILSDNTSVVTPELEGAYESYNLYTTSIGAGEEKTYHLKIWLDYDATVEQAASKVYQSKINVIANPDTQVIDTLEAKFSLEGSTLTSTLTDNVTSASYCTTTDNICTPNTSATIENNSYTVELESKEENQMVCTRLNGTSKVICSNSLEVKPITNFQELIASKTLATRTDFSTTLTTDTTGTIYYADTSKGRTYYFAGNPTDNWVRFGGFYWRIIRINEDGTLRLIYQGTAANTTGTNTQIQTRAFNSSYYNNNAGVGYMYQSNQVHGLSSNSTIKGILDTWYQNNLTSVADKIDGNAGFCGDRQPSTSSSSSNGSGGTGSTQTYYGAYIRLYGNNKAPTFECQNESDLYTTSGSEQGNKALTYPIGLISLDEAWYAGGYQTANSNYYLYTGQYYWTLSPGSFGSGWAIVFRVNSVGALGDDGVNYSYGVRPVINLKANVQITGGNGSSSNPYVIL